MRCGIATLTAVGALALAPAALAQSRYVDQGTGTDTANDCTQSTNPCKTILRGVSQAGAGDTVFVEGGHTYTSSITLDAGKSLVGKDFLGTGAPHPILDNGNAGGVALTTTGTGGVVKDMTIRSEFQPLEIDGTSRISYDTFDDPDAIATQREIGIGSAPVVTIEHNHFVDPTPLTDSGAGQTAISGTLSSPAISRLRVIDNDFKGFFDALAVGNQGVRVTASHNRITGTHDLTDSQGNGIWIFEAERAEIVANKLTRPMNALNDVPVEGIFTEAPGSVSRNLVTGYGEGIAENVQGPVALDDDVVLGGYLCICSDSGYTVRATNMTLWNRPAADSLFLRAAHLRLDSSIVGPDGILDETGTCAITHSQGPGHTDHHLHKAHCDDFQTHANPRFKPDGYHIKGSSPLIDKGSKTSPPRHMRDIDGNPRALPGDCSKDGSKKKRRDIGADEFVCPHHR